MIAAQVQPHTCTPSEQMFQSRPEMLVVYFSNFATQYHYSAGNRLEVCAHTRVYPRTILEQEDVYHREANAHLL